MNMTLPRRAYRHAEASGVQVELDGKVLATPARTPCIFPTPHMATAIAAEWEGQGEQVNPASMPLTQLAFTAIDRVPGMRDAILEEAIRYLGTELICHYADEVDVAAHQRAVWQFFHDWLKSEFDVALPVTTSIVPLPESDTAWAALHIARYDDFRLSALQQAVAVTGSFVIALALVEGAVDATSALAAAEAEADYNSQKWGSDAERAARHAGQLLDLRAVQQFIDLLQA